MVFFAAGSPDRRMSLEEARTALRATLDELGPRMRVLTVPPDITRLHSLAGPLTEAAWEHYGEALTDVLPAIGTHAPMTGDEIGEMFGRVPPRLFRVHDWRSGTESLGSVPGDYVKTVSEGRVQYAIPIEVDRRIVEGAHDLILSIGQVVPHEVVGMAGHIKNIFVGTGGFEAINRTHFLGAAYGMERIMGRTATPVRNVLDYGANRFARHLPIVHVLTVVGREESGGLVLRGLFIGDDRECFQRAAELALKVNLRLLDVPLRKVVVFLDPRGYKSTWLGNKSIYRTRMAIADGGELVVLAPGVERFGEDPEVDTIIRKYGYAGTLKIFGLMKSRQDLRESLCAAAHLIHGSSEGRFDITYCPGRLTREEIESVNYRYASLEDMTKRYDPAKLADGFNTLADGEEVFYISNPALGLWAARKRFD
jgi:nickel-dependent lactate racemase